MLGHGTLKHGGHAEGGKGNALRGVGRRVAALGSYAAHSIVDPEEWVPVAEHLLQRPMLCRQTQLSSEYSTCALERTP